MRRVLFRFRTVKRAWKRSEASGIGKITEPLANVFGLHRRYNQAYGLKDVVWSGFVTEGMNLGETQDHTCCLSESFAKIWQKRYSEKRADRRK